MEPKQANAGNMVVYQADGQEIRLTPEIVRGLLVNGDSSAITAQEVAMFIRLCQYQRLNPFVRDAYLIKFGNNPATMVTGKYVFTRRAASHPQCAGWQSGIITENADGEMQYRKGTVHPSGEKIIGGYCDIRRKDWTEPMRKTVAMSEYAKNYGNWKVMPATMIEKVATVAGLREAFPDALGGLYDADEMPVNADRLPTEPVEAPKQIEKPVQVVKPAEVETLETMPNTPAGNIPVKPVKTAKAEQIAEKVRNAMTGDFSHEFYQPEADNAKK